MKKVLLIWFILTFNLIFAQENIVKVNPIAFAFNGAEISYESIARQNQSFEIVLAFASFKNDLPDYNYRVYGAEARYKFYLLNEKRNFKGLYLAPTGTLEQVNFYQEYAAKTSSDFFGLGAILGYQFLLNNEENRNGFVIDLNGGFTNFFGNSTITLNNKTIGFVPRVSIGLGYSF